MQRCPTCDGEGVVRGTFATAEGEPVSEVVCPICHGNGQLDPAVSPAEGLSTPDHREDQ